MKTILDGPCVLGVVVSALFFALPAQAGSNTLAPGTNPAANSSTFGTSGTLLNTVPATFSSPGIFSGTLTTKVYNNDPSNPYGLGDLTFTYQFSLDAASAEAASQFTISSFDSFSTDVSYNGTVAPGTFSRSNEGSGSGKVIHANFLSPEVGPGQSSALIVIQTNATNSTPSTAVISDGQAANANSLSPLAVPEPGSCTLLAAGLGALTLARRRRVY